MNVTEESVLTLRNCLMHLQALKKEEPDKSDLLNRQLWDNAYFEVISDLSSTLVNDFGFSKKKLDNLLAEIDTDFNHFETYISGMADYVQNQLKEAEERKLSELKTTISGFYKRAKTLLELANRCADNHINFRKEMPESYGLLDKSAGFCCSYDTKIGFMKTTALKSDGMFTSADNTEKFDAIGFNDISFSEIVALYEDRLAFLSHKKNSSENLNETQIFKIEQFIQIFPKFEQAFLNYIESLNDKPHAWAKVQWPPHLYHYAIPDKVFVPEKVYENAESEDDAKDMIKEYLQETYHRQPLSFAVENLSALIHNKDLDNNSLDEIE